MRIQTFRLCFLALVALSVGLAACTSKIRVRQVVPNAENGGNSKPNVSSTGGVYYALPRTVMVASIPVLVTKFTNGIFCGCAVDALPEYPEQETHTACKNESPSFSIETALLSTRGEPDPGSVYEIDVRGGYFEDKSLNLQFTEDGILTHGEAESTNHGVEFAMATIGAAAKITAGVLALKSTAGTCSPAQLQEANKVVRRIQYMTQLRDNILRTVAGSASVESLQFRIKPYQDQIDSDLTKYFFGRKNVSVLWTGQFEMLPGAANATYTLFKLDPERGVCADTTQSGVTVLNLFKGTGDAHTPGIVGNAKECPLNATEVRLRFSSTGASAANAITTPSPKKGGTGFYYRIPGTATISIEQTVADSDESGYKATTSTLQIVATRVSVAQLGKTVWMPVSTGGRRTQYVFDLVGTSGGLKNFKVASDAVLDKSMAADLATAATTIIDAQKERAKAKEKPSDLEALKEEADTLEQRKRILELQKAIDDLTEQTTESQQ